MEALVPAFVAALLIQAGDRAAWLAAILADRYQAPLRVALAALLAHGVGNAIACVGGLLVAPLLTPNAKQLLLALALGFAAFGSLGRSKPLERLEGWRVGGAATALLGIFILALGDSTQFLTFAISARSGWLAAVGATLGAFTIAIAAALLGERAWRRLPLGVVRIGFGLLALGAAAINAASALRLI